MFNQRFDDALDFDADWELAPQFVETIGTGAAPDHAEELDAFVSLEARIEDLLVLRGSIMEASGMSQGFAREAQRLLPEFDQQRPLGFYSTAPSATRYAVAIEELSNGVWSLIAAGIAAVIAVIVKFINWLRKGKEGAAQESIKDTATKFTEAQKLLADCHRLIEQGKGDLNGKYFYLEGASNATEHFSLDTMIKSEAFMGPHGRRVGEFLETKDPYFHDLVNRGAYFKEMSELAPVFKNLQLILRQRLNVLEAISRLDLNDDSATSNLANVKMLAALKEAMTLSYQGKDSTLQEIKTSVDQVTREVGSQSVSGNLSFDHLFGSMTDALKSSEISVSLQEVVALTPLLDKMKTELQSLEAKAGSYSSDGKKGKHSTLIGTDLRHAIFVLGSDLAALTSITAEVMQYQHRLIYLAVNAAAFAEAVAKKLGESGRTQDGGHMDAWKKIAKELGEKHKALQSLSR